MAEQRLIDANELVKALYEDRRIALFDGTRMGAGDLLIQRYSIRGLIEDAPTIDAVPVVHGRWIEDRKGHYKCSICDDMWGYAAQIMNYCLNCGAKMDGGESDG